jgi:hypothetical protein
MPIPERILALLASNQYATELAAFLGQPPGRPDARALDPSLRSIKSALGNRIKLLDAEVLRSSSVRSQIGSRPTSQTKLLCAVFTLALNLLDALRIHPDLCIGLPLRKNWYSTNAAAKAASLSYKYLCKIAYPAFLEHGLVEHVAAGFADRKAGYGETTRIRGTTKLANLLAPDGPPQFWEVQRTMLLDRIVLRNEKKTEIPFEDTPLTLKAREHLRTINTLFRRHLIDLRLPDQGYARLYAYRKRDASLFDLSRIVLHRTFNNACLLNPKVSPEGGRFYGVWWQ